MTKKPTLSTRLTKLRSRRWANTKSHAPTQNSSVRRIKSSAMRLLPALVGAENTCKESPIHNSVGGKTECGQSESNYHPIHPSTLTLMAAHPHPVLLSFTVICPCTHYHNLSFTPDSISCVSPTFTRYLVQDSPGWRLQRRSCCRDAVAEPQPVHRDEHKYSCIRLY